MEGSVRIARVETTYMAQWENSSAESLCRVDYFLPVAGRRSVRVRDSSSRWPVPSAPTPAFGMTKPRSQALWHKSKASLSSRQQEPLSKAQAKGWRDLNLHEAQERHGQEMTFTAQPITSRAAAGGRKDSGDSCLP